MWEYVLTKIAVDPLSLGREIDWVIKYNLIDAYMNKNGYSLNHPAVSLIDLQYHDVSRERGIFYRLNRRNLVERMVDDETIDKAMEFAPTTTRARLRGEFIKKANEKRRDFTVDWVHLKLNDQAQRTVLLKDPFRSEDERVDKLLESL